MKRDLDALDRRRSAKGEIDTINDQEWMDAHRDKRRRINSVVGAATARPPGVAVEREDCPVGTLTKRKSNDVDQNEVPHRCPDSAPRVPEAK